MTALFHRIVLATGWQRALIAFVAGAVGALAMPPFGFWPALAASFVPAVWLIDGSAAGERYSRAGTLWRAAAAGWFWGFGYFVAGLWWLGAAFLVQAEEFAYLLPFGVVGLPAVLAIFPAAGFALARALWSRGVARLFAFAFGLSVSEWLRGHLFTGFPWNLPGMALGQSLTLMQAASLVGVYGLTLLAVLLFAAPATLATEDTRFARWSPAAVAAALFLALASFGTWRLSAEPPPPVAGVRMRLVQPNIAQDAKFGPAQGPEILRGYLELSDRSTSPTTTGLRDVTHLIWPESAFPFILHREAAALSEIAHGLPRGGVLITGAARMDDPLPGESGWRYFNSIQAVTDTGAIVATYDKVHLVPFGEYVPSFVETTLRDLGLRQFVAIPGGFSAGSRHALLRVPGLPSAAATICYEAVFPDETLPTGPRPGLILNVTNDGWFGDTPGPRQHFAQAQLRAVETGLPLVRAANTGISAVVDAYGRVVHSLPVGQAGVIDSSLPGVANPTFFSKFGNLTFVGMCVFCAVASLIGRLRRGTT
jgi:apolipoprotein N-acyltransferase